MNSKELIINYSESIILIVMGTTWICNDTMEPKIFLFASLITFIKIIFKNSPLFKSDINQSNLNINIEPSNIENLSETELNSYYGQLFVSKTKEELINLKTKIDQIFEIKNNLPLNTKNIKFEEFYTKLLLSISNTYIIFIFVYNLGFWANFKVGFVLGSLVFNLFIWLTYPQLTPSQETLVDRLKRFKLRLCLIK